MESIMQELVKQLPMVAVLIIVVFWLLKRQDEQAKCDHERRKEELEIQAVEAEKQRRWNEEQGLKRDEFTREINKSNQLFYEKLSQDQAESNKVVAETIRLVERKTDVIIEKLDGHDKHSKSAFDRTLDELHKWSGGIKKE